jgi:hypothetical protein
MGGGILEGLRACRRSVKSLKQVGEEFVGEEGGRGKKMVM